MNDYPLIESTEKEVKKWAEYLRQVIRARELINNLPEAILKLAGSANCGYANDLRLVFHTYDNPDVDLLKELKLAGVQELTPKMSTPQSWFADGIFTNNGITASVDVYGLPKPEHCVIEEYTEKITKYKAICTETGKEL